jgi:hypothetical protein
MPRKQVPKVAPDELTPLEKLKRMPPEQITPEDCLAVRSGTDDVSKIKKEVIPLMLGDGEWEEIVESFDKEKYQLSAARWRLRGLPLTTAIRKVQIEREEGRTIAEKRRGYDWREGTSYEDYED